MKQYENVGNKLENGQIGKICMWKDLKPNDINKLNYIKIYTINNYDELEVPTKTSFCWYINIRTLFFFRL